MISERNLRWGFSNDSRVEYSNQRDGHGKYMLSFDFKNRIYSYSSVVGNKGRGLRPGLSTAIELSIIDIVDRERGPNGIQIG